MKKLPIGIQSIRDILTEGYVYVNKTRFALELIQSRKHCFFSRPRRFGKSLFLSTLKEIFLGNKELFKGCQIYDSDYDWQAYPVLHLDFAEILNESTQDLKDSLKRTFAAIAAEHETKIEIPGESIIQKEGRSNEFYRRAYGEGSQSQLDMFRGRSTVGPAGAWV